MDNILSPEQRLKFSLAFQPHNWAGGSCKADLNTVAETAGLHCSRRADNTVCALFLQ